MAEEEQTDKNEWIEDLTGTRDAEADEEVADAQARASTGEEEATIEEAVSEGEEVAKEDGRIPVSVLTSERDKYQARIGALEGTINAQGQEINRFQGLAEEIRSIKAAQESEPAAPEPDYLEDPKAYIDSKVGTTLDQLRNVENTVQQTTESIGAQGQALTQQRQIQAIQSAASAGEENFAKQTPDYWEALEYARTARAGQLKLAFPDANDAQLTEHIRAEEFSTATQILQQGRNPAEFAYKYAASLGYTAGGTEQAAIPRKNQGVAKEDAQGLGSAGTSSELDSLLNLESDEFDQALKEVFG